MRRWGDGMKYVFWPATGSPVGVDAVDGGVAGQSEELVEGAVTNVWVDPGARDASVAGGNAGSGAGRRDGATAATGTGSCSSAGMPCCIGGVQHASSQVAASVLCPSDAVRNVASVVEPTPSASECASTGRARPGEDEPDDEPFASDSALELCLRMPFLVRLAADDGPGGPRFLGGSGESDMCALPPSRRAESGRDSVELLDENVDRSGVGGTGGSSLNRRGGGGREERGPAGARLAADEGSDGREKLDEVVIMSPAASCWSNEQGPT